MAKVGRKPLSPFGPATRQLTVRMTQQEYDAAKLIGEGSVTLGVLRALQWQSGLIKRPVARTFVPPYVPAEEA